MTYTRAALVLLATVLVFLPTVLSAAVQQSFYVCPTGLDTNPGTQGAPFQTLERARTAVRTVNTNMTGDIEVNLCAGRHARTATLQLTQLDSGTNGFRVYWQALPGQIAQVSGGRIIPPGSWTATTGGTFKAPLGGADARQFYVNGVRAQRACLPNTWPAPSNTYRTRGSEQSNRRIRVTTTELAGITAPLSTGLVEIIWAGQYADLNFVTGTSSAGGGETWLNVRDDSALWQYVNGRPYSLCNALEYLDTPGEFWINRTTQEIHYRPRAGETLSTATAIVPQVETLLSITGASAANRAHHITFKNLRFEHTTYLGFHLQGCTHCGEVGGGDLESGGREYTGSIATTFTDAITLEDNVFRHLGNMVAVWTAARNVVVRGNVHHDLALGGHYFRGTESFNSDTSLQCVNVTVDNNYFTKIAQDRLPWHMAVSAYSVDTIAFTHNEVLDPPTGGIDLVGWDDTVPRRNANISFNKIGTGCQGGGFDFGAVYVWGAWDNSHVTENWLYGNNSLYGDCGGWYCDGGYAPERCEHWLVDNNVFEDNGGFNTYLNDAVDCTLVNVPGTIDNGLWDNSPGENTYSNPGGLNVTNVKNNAGLQAAYLGIKTKVTEDVGAPVIVPPGVVSRLRVLQR